MGMDLKEDDYIEHLFVASTHDYLLFFTSVGKVYRLKVHELPLGLAPVEGPRRSSTCCPFRQGEQMRAVVQTRDFERGRVPRLRDEERAWSRRRSSPSTTRTLKADGIIAINLREGDELVGVRHSTGDDDILMVSRSGQAIRFHEQAARPMGRATAGVQGMRLRKDDEVIDVAVASDDDDLLVVTENRATASARRCTSTRARAAAASASRPCSSPTRRASSPAPASSATATR